MWLEANLFGVAGVGGLEAGALTGVGEEDAARCGEGSERIGKSWDCTGGNWVSSLVSQLGSGSKGGGGESLRVVNGEVGLAARKGFCSLDSTAPEGGIG